MIICFCGDYIPAQHIEVAQGKHIIGNFECTFSETIKNSGKAYTSVLPNSFLNKFQEGISSFAALNMANNHVYDAGIFKNTYQQLKEMFPSVQFFGTKEKPFAELLCGDQKNAVIGCLEQCRSRGPELFHEEQVISLITQIKRKYQRIYVYPHWGKESEYTRYPGPRQIKLAHKWIDAGADGVFGCHSHVFQGHEEYHGKPVFYSLGNYFFPHPESSLYPGTDLGMTVEIAPLTGEYCPYFHRFDESGLYPVQDDSAIKALLNQISTNLSSWNYRKWGREIGDFYIRKNMASWKKRIWKKFPINLIKFLVWNVLPLTVLFRISALLYPPKYKND